MGLVWPGEEPKGFCSALRAMPRALPCPPPLELTLRCELLVRRPHLAPDLLSYDHGLSASREGILCIPGATLCGTLFSDPHGLGIDT